MVKNQFNVTIKKFQSNNAIDCFNQVLTPFFQYEGIIHESSCVNTPQQNGVAKRKNGHLLDTTRAFLFQNHVLESCWEKVVLTATHLINQLPSRGKTSRKTRIGIPISLIYFPLTPLKVTGPVPIPSTIDPIPEPESVPKPESSPTKSAKNRMTSKVYSSKKATVPRLIQVQEPEPASGNEINYRILHLSWRESGDMEKQEPKFGSKVQCKSRIPSNGPRSL
ncbi:hypothetical protein CK203_073311 [Vitis vinifera]|uniref:Integrase catalytic domain-containing protein n=1 Tax=Vitis vinifera TaxID=29760 RepID=A0A438ESP7_VITVI|nr:hypothetical protein CK203_073311 [Vitis vinifera]